MKQSDKKRFAEILNDLAEVYDKPALSALKLRAFWGVLEEYPFEAVEKAIDMHMRDPERGRWMPVPADLLANIKTAVDQACGRPSADEAWAIALQASDERETVVWTDEIAEAFGVAQEILDAGDKIGARMAFKAAYEKAAQGVRKVKWIVSIGYDQEKRASAITEAVDKGLLTSQQARKYLPAPEITPEGHAIAGLLTGKVTHLPGNSEAKRRIEEIRKALGRIGNEPE